MSVFAVPVDQRVIDIDSRRFASIEKALVELITNCDDSYTRLEQRGVPVSGRIQVSYERHLTGALLIVTDQAEGMSMERMRSVLTYGGAHSPLAKGEAGGRGYFGRGMKQAVFGLGYGWIEGIHEGRYARIELFRAENGGYLYEDGGGDREAAPGDYERLGIAANGTRLTIVVENLHAGIPHFRSLLTAVANNVYLRDILERRQVELANRKRGKIKERQAPVRYEEPPARLLLGPEEQGVFVYAGEEYGFTLTVKRAQGMDLILKGDERTSGLLVLSGTAVLDCQFFQYENQVGTEYLFGAVRCAALTDMLSRGRPVVTDDRDGLNLKDPFVAAFAQGVSQKLAPLVKAEQEQLQHIERATTSDRTGGMIQRLLQRMNRVAVEDLGIVVPPGPGTGSYGPYASGREAVLRFTTPFYYRKVDRPFRVTLLVDRSQLPPGQELSVSYLLPPSLQVEPAPLVLTAADLGESGRLEWLVRGSRIGDHGRLGVLAGNYAAWCELAIGEDASGAGYGHPGSRARHLWNQDNGVDLFVGYQLRNLNNELERAVYSREERMILINTGAPTVRLYVDGRGHFRDAARLLLAELFMDVIVDELAHRYVDRSGRKGDFGAYRAAKQDLVRRYGTEIHRYFLGE